MWWSHVFNVAEITNKQFAQKAQREIQSALPEGITLENEGMELTSVQQDGRAKSCLLSVAQMQHLGKI